MVQHRLSHLDRAFPKRQFNVNNKEDLKTYKQFLVNRRWGRNGCPFELEWPWLSIPDMLNYKIAESMVSKL